MTLLRNIIKAARTTISAAYRNLSGNWSSGLRRQYIGRRPAQAGGFHETRPWATRIPFSMLAKRRNCFHGDEKLLVSKGDGFELLTIRELVERNLIGRTEKMIWS